MFWRRNEHGIVCSSNMNTQLQVVFEIARYHGYRRIWDLIARFFQLSLDISIEPQIIAHVPKKGGPRGDSRDLVDNKHPKVVLRGVVTVFSSTQIASRRLPHAKV